MLSRIIPMGMAYDTAATAPIYSNYTYSVVANNEMIYSYIYGKNIPAATVTINLGANVKINGKISHVNGTISFDSANQTINA